MAGHVYHWKHGWIPLDHAAALSKTKGDKGRAAKMLGDAKSASAGIKSRRDVAGAILTLPNVPTHERAVPKQQIADAAREHRAQDLLPPSMKALASVQDRRSAALSGGLVQDLRGGSADAHLVTDEHGTRFSAERAALHDQIIGRVLGDHKAQEHPSFVMLGGGPASGKSKAAEQAARDFPDAVKVDPDELKKMLPEYAKMSPDQAASFVHEESSYLAKRATAEALKRRTNVVLDAVGDNSVASVQGKIDQARRAGYSVHARYVTVPVDVAQARAHARGVKSGRVVPGAVIEHSHRGVSDVFPQVMHEFDSAALYDNTAEWRLVLEAHRNQPALVHELELWREFLRKAHR